MTFKDHFSGHAASYAAFRPHYSPELFAWVAALPARRHLALDCATGSGQAAVGIAEHFDRVIAIDASAEQILHALPHPRVEYRQARAEDSGLPSGSVDLVTVAAGLHWLDFDRFYAEVERVLAPGGALAAWTYNLARVTPEVDTLMDRLAHKIAGPWWPPERRWVNEEYRTVPFPFAEVAAPDFWIEERWDLQHFILYLGTWSATARYRKETGQDAVDVIRRELEEAWGDPAAVRTVRWPISLRAGYPRPEKA